MGRGGEVNAWRGKMLSSTWLGWLGISDIELLLFREYDYPLM